MEKPKRAERLIRLPEVETRTGLKKSTIYLRMKQGVFPACVRQGPRTVAWPESRISAYIDSIVAESDKGVGVRHG